MTTNPLDQLNEGQRSCLRLVLGHKNSKEIARELNVSPHTVDQRLRVAIRVLDASSRFEAARKFAEIDPEPLPAEAYQSLIYQRPDVAETVIGGDIAIAAEHPADSLRWPLPSYRGERNQLTTAERLGWIIVIAIGSAVSFGGVIAGLEALTRLIQ
jgi:DNA-binding CsgD family transcriptional regulator